MDQQKAVIVAQRVGAFGFALVGIVIFSWGTSYFQERLMYNVPRILVPVYELLGNVGLAVGMLVLGGGLVWWGLSQWKAAGGKVAVYYLVAAAGIALGIVLANVDFRNSGDIMEDTEQRRQEQIDEFRDAKRPDLNSAEADACLDKFTEIYDRFKKNIESGDQAAILASEEDFSEWSTSAAEVMNGLDNDAKYEFSVYHAKLAIDWNDLRASLRDVDDVEPI